MNTNEPQDETEAEIHVNNVYKGKWEDSMDYELYKKLKDMGFEQEGSGFGEPTLSELIEACGGKITSLEFKIDGVVAKGGISHGLKYAGEVFTKENMQPNEYFLTTGSTPQEAVAKLWIELNK